MRAAIKHLAVAFVSFYFHPFIEKHVSSETEGMSYASIKLIELVENAENGRGEF